MIWLILQVEDDMLPVQHFVHRMIHDRMKKRSDPQELARELERCVYQSSIVQRVSNCFTK